MIIEEGRREGRKEGEREGRRKHGRKIEAYQKEGIRVYIWLMPFAVTAETNITL